MAPAKRVYSPFLTLNPLLCSDPFLLQYELRVFGREQDAELMVEPMMTARQVAEVLGAGLDELAQRLDLPLAQPA